MKSPAVVVAREVKEDGEGVEVEDRDESVAGWE